MKRKYFAPIGSSLLLVSCVVATPRTYYMSPLDVRASPYVTLPMIQDPEKTITTASAGFGGGGSNEKQRDGLIAGSLSLMQSRHFGHFQAYYGGVFGLGKWSGDSVSIYDAPYFSRYPGHDSVLYHVPATNAGFGYYGLNGGINLVVPFPGGRGEWRALGLDLAYRREFGNYATFRGKLPANLIDILAGYDHVFAIGGSTEIVARSKNGSQVAYKIGLGTLLYPGGQYSGDSTGSHHPYYMTHTLSVTKQRVTGFLQVAVGAHAFNVSTGVNVNLRRRRKPFLPPAPPARR